ncbi:hypothetical protein VSU01S_23690 [Vibrio superstes NBRC 103154]|uniref:Uncharacterized protein n=1 Tax=Vibrio superstes NBRC 103154 TaxID=1219062 RepID=A0A511QRZ0_9VIBR|nr:hypothetical protein VSU01S_23690 [Vibrio superstes NBRC 103154]
MFLKSFFHNFHVFEIYERNKDGNDDEWNNNYGDGSKNKKYRLNEYGICKSLETKVSSIK